MKKQYYCGILSFALIAYGINSRGEMPSITGKPLIDAPRLLDWPTDEGTVTPNLNDSTSNILNDLHGSVSSCDLLLSTEGNYHPALHDVWPFFLNKFKGKQLKNWLYTTSPPVSYQQIKHKILGFGNLRISCVPSVVVASGNAIEKLAASGYIEGHALALYEDRGAVILVKRGNPKRIQALWDLAREDVRFVTPNPELEPGAFDNYLRTIFGIASHDKHPPEGMNAEKMIRIMFCAADNNAGKWLAGARIHHRDLPWSVAYGKADAAIIFYHLGLYARQTFPDLFDIVPLGGTIADPRPFEGTVTTTRFVARVRGKWSPLQIEAREKLIETLLSDAFTKILINRGLLRSKGFKPM